MPYTYNLNTTSDAGSGFERVRVDAAQTSFFEGREFRTFKELNIAPSTTYVVKIVVPLDIVLFGLFSEIESGFLRMATVIGGTEGGVYSDTLPIYPANNMSPGVNHRAQFGGVTVYTTQVVITGGGTHTGGTEIDITRIKTAGITQQATSVIGVAEAERGVAASTYYLRLENLSSADAITGVVKARWEERPSNFFNT